MASTLPANHFKFKLHHLQPPHSFNSHLKNAISTNPRRNLWPLVSSCHPNHHFHSLNPKIFPAHTVRSRVCSGVGDGSDASSHQSVSDADSVNNSLSSSGDGFVSLFVRMLGLDNDPLDREQAIVALWKYSLGGKQYVDTLMQFRGCIALTINLLKSESNTACEAAAGLLRMISSINSYRDLVAESGVIEEITALLIRFSLTSEVKEQSICTLWNLSVDEKLRVKIANSDLLALLTKFLDDEDVKVKEAAGGVLSNLALSQCNHSVMVEAGVIPKLAKFLTTEVERSKVIRKEAKTALLELAQDDYYRIIIMEEGLVLAPLVGAAAYDCFRPALHSWPSLPDGTEFKWKSKGPSRYGASELLLGLNIDDNNVNMDESKMNAIVGRTQQQFLARIRAIETEDKRNSDLGSATSSQYTLLPWKDGVARLVLILGLEDESAIARAANSIADACVNEHMRISFKEAGAIKCLVQLLDHKNDTVRLAVTNALHKLSISNAVCQAAGADGLISPLVGILKDLKAPESLMEKTLIILARILDPTTEMKSKFYDAPVNGSKVHETSQNPTTGLVRNMWESCQSVSTAWEDLLDSVLIARLVEILKTSSPTLQRKATSILEFMAFIKPCRFSLVTSNIESGLVAIFQQKVFNDMGADADGQEPGLYDVDIEETGAAISDAARLLTKLLDFDEFWSSINSKELVKLLREILKSEIPLRYRDWIAACLVRLSSLTSSLENPISTEVTFYETIPRLIQQIETSVSPESREAAVVSLNRIISEGVVDFTRAVAAKGGIFPLVKLIEEGGDRAVEAGLAILYNLSMDVDNHPAILAAGAVPVLRRIVLSERPQWIQALRLLRMLPI
ncbi:hypothetical protein Nepgr_019654 [Nepenthes gracilis]|uniref:ARM repeat superfamily protein n=1 Tax=Nepenthes gracilis TaxID=150966 RepID=A0AAD3SUF0_NEPGR|nr:hypothetical protein Nepgr_019654 [Nepenthes gracilis]